MSTPLFNRRAELILSNGYTFTIKEGVRFNFHYTTTNELNIPLLEMEIPNLKQDLRNVFTSGMEAIFNIGFGSFVGELTSGNIINIEEVGNILKFDIISSSVKFYKKYSNWYNEWVRDKFIVEEIASNLGLFINGVELLGEYKNPNGRTVRGPGITSIRKICNSRGLGVTTRGNLIEIYKLDSSGVPWNIILRWDSGLVNVTKYTNDDKKYDYILHSLPIPTIAIGDLVKFEHEKASGVAKVFDIEIEGKTNWKAKYFIKVVG